LRLQLLAFGDISGNAAHADDLALLIAHRCFHCPVDARLASGLDDIQLFADQGFAICQHLAVVELQLVRDVQVEELAIVLAHHIVQCQAKQLAHHIVGVGIATAGVLGVDVGANVIQHLAQAQQFAQQFLHILVVFHALAPRRNGMPASEFWQIVRPLAACNSGTRAVASQSIKSGSHYL